MGHFVATKLEGIDKEMTVEQVWSTIKSSLVKGADKFIPSKLAKPRKSLPYISADLENKLQVGLLLGRSIHIRIDILRRCFMLTYPGNITLVAIDLCALRVLARSHTSARKHAHAHTHTFTFTYTHTHLHIHTRSRIHAHTLTYTHIHTHTTYTHTRTHNMLV